MSFRGKNFSPIYGKISMYRLGSRPHVALKLWRGDQSLEAINLICREAYATRFFFITNKV